MLALLLGLALTSAAADGSVLDRYLALSKRYDAERKAFSRAFHAADHDQAKEAEARKLAPDDAAYAARFFILADEEPAGPAASDALNDVLLLQSERLTPSGREAIRRLRRDFLAGPKMANYVEELSRRPWPEVEPMLRDVLARSPERNARGLACMGLARKLAAWSTIPKALDDPEAARQVRATYEPDLLAAILRLDPVALLAEATALNGRVLAEFADVPLFPAHQPDDRTIGPIAQRWLDGQQATAVGREAPAIDGRDLDGKPLRLADYRGKVVVLVFSASWCGWCLKEIPHEKALAARMQGRPFALLGVNCDSNIAAARALAAREGITWPEWFDGDPAAPETRDGPIQASYGIQSYPTVLVLDERGVIRDRDVRGQALDEAVDRLLKAMNTPPGDPGAATGPGG